MSARDTTRPPIRIAMLGGGTVGSSIAKLLARHQHDLAHRVGADLELVSVGDSVYHISDSGSDGTEHSVSFLLLKPHSEL